MPKQKSEEKTPTAEEIVECLSPEEKRALALKLLGGTDADEELRKAEQEKQSQVRLEQVEKDWLSKLRKEPHFWIEINRRAPDDGETHVFVGCAGVPYWIQKDVKVPVPQSVLNIPDNAVITGHVPIIDESLQVTWIKKQ